MALIPKTVCSTVDVIAKIPRSGALNFTVMIVLSFPDETKAELKRFCGIELGCTDVGTRTSKGIMQPYYYSSWRTTILRAY